MVKQRLYRQLMFTPVAVDRMAHALPPTDCIAGVKVLSC
jgi:hypothetical protein